MGNHRLSMRIDREVSDFPSIRNVEPVPHDAMLRMIGSLERHGSLPEESYAIEAKAHWDVGQQTQLWSFTVTFQSMEGSRQGWKALTGD